MKCQWFAMCSNDAIGKVAHPTLGDVPICERCLKRSGERLLREWDEPDIVESLIRTERARRGIKPKGDDQ